MIYIATICLCVVGGLHLALLLHIPVVMETVVPFLVCVARVVVAGMGYCCH